MEIKIESIYLNVALFIGLVYTILMGDSTVRKAICGKYVVTTLAYSSIMNSYIGIM